MNIIISNTIQIHDAPEKVLREITKGLTLANPLYHRLLRMGKVKALWGVKKEFKYFAYDKPNNVLYIGRGNEGRLRDYLDRNVSEYEITEKTCDRKLSRSLVGEITLRSYQQGSIEEITKNRNGIIKLGTGWGKTILACELTKNLGVTTLIIVPRTNILSQFSAEFRKWFGYKVGIIQGEKEEIKEVTIASIQTLIRRPALVKKMSQSFGMVIYDEAHLSVTDKQISVIQSFNPKYLYGMSATPDRNDGQGKAIQFIFGNIVIDADVERANPKVLLVPFDGHIVLSEAYNEIIDSQVNNEERNKLIVGHINNEISNGHRVLVLTKRIEHYKILLALAQVKLSYSIDSSSKGKERYQLLKELRTGKRKFNVIYGTMSMLATGVDIPQLSCLIIAGDLRSSILLHQGSGRIRRLFEGKENPKILDIIDTGNKILSYQAKSRIKVYREWGWI